MHIADFLNRLPAAAKPDAIDGAQYSVQLTLSEPFHLQIQNGVVSVQPGDAPAPDVTLAAEDADLIAILCGRTSGVMAYMAGKLQIDGDLMLAKQLPDFFDSAKLA